MKQLRTKSINWARAALTLLLVLLASTGAQAIEESQVTLLQAIKSTGAQAFNTGYTHKANTRVELDCEVTKNSQRSWEALFGGRLGSYAKNAFVFFSRHQHNISAAINEPCFNRSGVETDGTNFVYDERIKLVCEGTTATWYKYSDLNTVVSSITTSGTADDGKTPMFLFELNTASSEGGTQEDNSKSVMTLYGCKIYEGSTLMRDYMPAKYNNVVGLYDRVNKTFSGSITSTAFLAVNDPAPNNQADYERALAAIEDGKGYRIYTMYNGQKYYVTADGKLSTAVTDASPFEFSKVAPKSSDGDGEYEYGFHVKLHKNGYTYYFSNSDDENGKKLKVGYLNIRKDYSRTTWEAQVFFLNAEGKYAVRCTNAKSGDSGWNLVGSAFWTVDADTNGPLAQYDYDMNYVWELEEVFCISTNGTAGTSTSENYDKLVDGNKSTKWCVSSFSSAFVEFHTPRAIMPTGYVLTTGDDNATWKGRNPKSWTIKAKANISDDWTTLATVTNDNTMQDVNTTDYEFSIDNTKAYQYFRFEISAVQSGTIFQLSEFAFLYNDAGVQMLDYNRALKAIKDEGRYRIFTMVGTQKYYLTGEGKLSTDVDDAPLFTFTKVSPSSSEREYENGFYLKNGNQYFTNSSKEDGSSLKEGHICVRTNNPRNTWEAQVFFLNSEGKFAVRSTNAVSGDTGWAKVGTAFWTVDSSTNGPVAEYSYDMNYLWEIEGELPDEPTITKQQIGDLYYNLNGDTKTAEVTFKDDADNYDANFQLTNFKDIVIPETVTYKGVEYEVTRIGDNAFREGRGMNSVTIPNTVTSIGKYALSACVAIQGGIVIPESVTVIEEYAFNNSNISELIIPNSVTTVGGYIIEYSNTKALTIGKNVTSIDQYAFRSSNLKEIHSLIKNPTEIADETFYDDVYSTATLYVPVGTKTLYQNTNGWKKFSNIEEDESEFTGTELLLNGQCDGTYDGWTKTDGGDGWAINDDNGDYYWVSSYRICKLTQTVTLSSFSISDEDIDNEKVICVASAEMKFSAQNTERKGARVNNIIVDMLDANDIQLATVTVLDDLNFNLNWTSFETKPFTLFPGTRKLRYTVRGQDAINNSHQWGPAYKNLSLQYMIGSQGGNNSGEPYSGKVLIGDLYYNLDGEAKTAVVTYRDDDYNSYSGNVAIPDKVTFRGTDYTVTTVGYGAFYDCKDLTSVTIPSSVTTIDSWAFQSCPSLTSFTIPRNVTKMGVNPFADCNGLTSLNVESGNTKYDSRDGCNAIIDSETDVLIAGCNATVIPNTVKTLGQECFASLTKMTSIVIPDGVETIGYGAFFDCDGLTSVDIANSVTAIDDYAFEECDNLSKITLPSQLETIGEGAFYNCDKLTQINLPNSLKSIGNYAFYNSSIKRIFSEMTDPCQLGSYVFYNIYSTATLVVPTGAKSNYQNTGTEWDNFSDIVDGEFKEIANADGIPFYYILHPDSKTAEVTCKLRTDEQNEYSYSGDIVIPETVNSDGVEYTVTSIGDYAFRYCSGLTSLTIPNSVTSIGIRSIQYCPNLTTLTIPGSVTTIKDYAFNTCEGLTTVTLSEGIQSIGIAVFGGDIRLTSLTIPKSVTSIGYYPSWGCEALTSLEVESGNTKYDSRGGCNAIIETETNTLIQGCNLTVIPSDVKAIGDYSFYYFTGLTGINLPDGLETIGRFAFYECENLTSIVIPSSVTSIDYAAFWGCTALREIHSLIETPFATGDYVFSDDTYTNATLYVPIGTKSAYEATELWSKFGNIVEEDYVVTYPVWVGDTQVTEANKGDVLGDGTVTYEPGEGTGTLTFSSGTTTINGMYNAAKIYADGIDLVINAPKGLVVESSILGIGMNGDNRKLTVNGDITFKTTFAPAINNCHDLIVNGNLSGTISSPISCSSITVNGNVNMSASNGCFSATTIVLKGTKHELSGGSPCISATGTVTITGDLTATSNNTPAINAGGDVTLVSGTWTLDGGTIRAIELSGSAKLNIPSNYAIIEPENAQMKSAGSGYNAYTTIADAEGNEATHVVIGDNSALVTYTVNITGGKAFAQEPDPYVPMEAPVTEFKAGSTVYILPNAVYGEYVTGWNTSPDIDITQKELVYYFKMPAENVTLTPVYSSQTPLTYDLSDGKQVRIGDNEDDLLALEGLLMIYWQKGQLLGKDEFDYYDLDGDGTNDITLYMDQDSEELVIQATDGTNLTGIYFTDNNISPFGPIRFKFSPEMLDEDSPEPTNFDKLTELGQEMSVILKRTLKTGGWNTFASPVTFSDFTNVFGEGVKVKQLKDATLTDGVLNLKFEDATTIEGFTPYLVKVAADVDLSQKTITGIVCDEPVIKETAALKFIPTMGLPQNSHTDDPKSVLFIGAGSKLYYADALPLDIKGFRAYFVLNEPDAVRSISMDFGEDGGATLVNSVGVNSEQLADEWYSVDGRKLSGRPTAKGVYINNGKKTIVK